MRSTEEPLRLDRVNTEDNYAAHFSPSYYED